MRDGAYAREARERRTAVKVFPRHKPRARGNPSARERPTNLVKVASRFNRRAIGQVVAPCSHEVQGQLCRVRLPAGELGARALRQSRDGVTLHNVDLRKEARTSQRNADKGRHVDEVGEQGARAHTHDGG